MINDPEHDPPPEPVRRPGAFRAPWDPPPRQAKPRPHMPEPGAADEGEAAPGADVFGAKPEDIGRGAD
jgi:hypothetical protein